MVTILYALCAFAILETLFPLDEDYAKRRRNQNG